MVRQVGGASRASSRLRRIKELRDQKSELDEQLKRINREIEELTEKALVDLEADGVDSMVITIGDDSFSAYPIRRSYCSITDKELFLEWCEVNEVEPLDIGFAPNASKLNSFWKERDESGESLPEGVEPYHKISIGFRKKAKK